MPRRFTLDEANALVPRLEELFAEVRRLRERQAAAQAALAKIEVTAKSNGVDRAEKLRRAQEALAVIVAELKSRVEQIEETGCEVKDLDTGLVDFLSLRQGRDVYLCWKSGEPEIRFWHELTTGFAGRQPL